MNRKVTIAGNLIVDTVKMIPAWPEKGMLVQIRSTARAVGGSIHNTGTDLRVLDPTVAVAGAGFVGDDDAGAFVVGTLRERGIDASRIGRVKGVPTSFTDCMTIEGTGERTFFNHHGADSRLTADDVDPTALGGGILHLGYLLLLDALDAPDAEYGTQAARLLAKAQTAGVKTSVDIVSEKSERFARVVRPALRYCDYAVINEVEAALATGVETRPGGRPSVAAMRRACEALFALGVRECVAIHCPEISVAADAHGDFSALGSLVLPDGWIVGATGAGDAFCAGMLLSFLDGAGLEDGMRLASCAAAANLRAADATDGALDRAATLALDARFPRRSVLAMP